MRHSGAIARIRAAPPTEATAPAEVAPPEGVLRAYVWECEDGRRLNMKNLFRENAITLEMHEGPRNLPQVAAASGARCSDGSLTFWTKGGTGNEPGWLVEIGPGARIEFVTAFGQERHAFDTATESAGDGNARVFTATQGDQSIQVTVTPAACTDDLSRAAFDHVVVVEFGVQSQRGCGTSLQ